MVILLEAHKGLWSQLSPESDDNEESRHLTLGGFLQQVNLLLTQADTTCHFLP